MEFFNKLQLIEDKRFDMLLRFLLLAVALLVFWGHVEQVYRIPLNKPYFDGQWDEPFAINSGINVLRSKGNPVFYNYGGFTAYSHAAIFYFYCKDKKIVPFYQEMDTKFKNPHWPIYRKIYPVKPIYIAKVVSFVLFLVAAFFFVGMAAMLLTPLVFWFIPVLMNSKMITYMATQMMPETPLTLLAGITFIFFAKAVLEKNISRYFTLVMICTLFASLTVAAKINASYIVLIPVSLLWRIFRENYFNAQRGGLFLAALGVPYILINPAAIFNFSSYKSWLLEMVTLSETNAGIWKTRLPQLEKVLKNVYLWELLPVIIIALLFLLACFLVIKKNPAALVGFLIFFFYSLWTILNMKHNFYGRHLMFLMLPFQLFLLFPFMDLFDRIPQKGKTVFSLTCLLITLWMFPPHQAIKKITHLKTKQFASWKRESRDELIDFVKNNNATLYFYDFHGFSLPNTIHKNIIPFTSIDEIPLPLKANEYVAVIRYKHTTKGVFNRINKYSSDLQEIDEHYQTIKTFGIAGGKHDINDQAPLTDPSIEVKK
jgi:hypothetical protein